MKPMAILLTNICKIRLIELIFPFETWDGALLMEKDELFKQKKKVRKMNCIAIHTLALNIPKFFCQWPRFRHLLTVLSQNVNSLQPMAISHAIIDDAGCIFTKAICLGFVGTIDCDNEWQLVNSAKTWMNV